MLKKSLSPSFPSPSFLYVTKINYISSVGQTYTEHCVYKDEWRMLLVLKEFGVQ